MFGTSLPDLRYGRGKKAAISAENIRAVFSRGGKHLAVTQLFLDFQDVSVTLVGHSPPCAVGPQENASAGSTLWEKSAGGESWGSVDNSQATGATSRFPACADPGVEKREAILRRRMKLLL